MEKLNSKTEMWAKRFGEWLVGTRKENGEQAGWCPIHQSDPDDRRSDSASFNFAKEKFYCFSTSTKQGERGCGGMSFQSLWFHIKEDDEKKDKKTRPASVRSIDDAPSKRQQKADSLPDEDDIQMWVEALTAAQPKMQALRDKRGLTKETVEKFKMGWFKDRFTIPVYDLEGNLLNVRRYNMNAKVAKEKMINILGHGEGRLFLPWVLRDNDEVIITEGEMDAIIGQQHGLPTMSHTSGAGTWKAEWSPFFEGKTVFVCYDCDGPGDEGAKKVVLHLGKYAKAIHVVKLPIRNIKGGDLTDYLVGGGYTADDFRALMEEARAKNESRTKTDIKTLPATATGLENSMSADLYGKPLELTVTVMAKVQPTYTMPKKMALECTMDFGAKCSKCPMEMRGGQWQKEIARDDSILLEMVDVTHKARRSLILESMAIPTTCPRVEIEDQEVYSVEEMIVMPAIDNRTEDTVNPVERRVYNVGEHDTQANSVQKITGVSVASPKDGRSTFQSWKTEPVQTNIDKFALTEPILKGLRKFRVGEGQKPLDKMREIALDLEANVTRIYGRPELHMAYDAVWHSAMDFKFRGVRLGKGWLELLVMGDTRTGKSEAAMRLTEHYQAGVLKSCEGATFAGLVGGAQQAGSNSWMVKWGVIPLNDRRLVILDEVSGIADKNVFEQMSAVRSSGVAQINKIVTQQTSARTRLIWISNPVDGRPIEQMGRGAIDGIQQLVKNPEDLARFDLAMSAASSDVKSGVINALNPPEADHVYVQADCSNLVAWAWSRKIDDIVWGCGVEEHVLTVSTELGERYVNEPPLVQIENARVKVARVAVAIAARVFSSSKDGEKLLVEKEHVDAAIELIDLLYSTESFGYARHSKRAIRERIEAEKKKRECYQFLLNNSAVLHGLRAVGGETFRSRDFGEFANMERGDEVGVAIVTLLEMRMIQRMSRGSIRMTAALVTVLRKLEDNGHI